MAHMDDMGRMDGMDAMDYMEEMEDPTIQICLNCTSEHCNGNCARVRAILNGKPDPGPDATIDGRKRNCGRPRKYGDYIADTNDIKALAKKWNKTLNRVYYLMRTHGMTLYDVDCYFAEIAARKAFINEMRPYTGDPSNVYRLLREGKTYDEIRAIYRNRPKEVA